MRKWLPISVIVLFLYVSSRATLSTHADTAPAWDVFSVPAESLHNSGANIIWQGTVDNTRAATDNDLFRWNAVTPDDLVQTGRVGGYGAHLQMPHGAAVHYIYFASLYGTVVQARAAYTARVNEWEDQRRLNNAGGSDGVQLKDVGDPGMGHFYSAPAANAGEAWLLGEMLFARGPYFVQVFLYLSERNYQVIGPAAIRLQDKLSRDLDALAQGEHLTPAPGSGTPTATAIPKAHHCKKGHVRVHGKCVKKPRGKSKP